MVDKLTDKIAAGPDSKHLSASDEQDASTLLPMLIAGLALIMIGMVAVVFLV